MQPRHRPGSCQVKPLPHGFVQAGLFRPLVHPGGGDVQSLAHLSQKVQPLLGAVQQGQVNIRPHDFQGDAGKSSPGAHIDHPGFFLQLAPGQQGHAVQKVFFHHLLRFGDGGQVHFFVPFQQQFHIQLELLRLPGRHLPSQCLGLLDQKLSNVLHVSLSPSRWPRSRAASQISSTEMSAGLTPEMRPAWPMFSGFTRLSFSPASRRSPCTWL